MLSATHCELMHINLYWSLIGSSLLVLYSALVKKTRRVFTSAAQRSAAQVWTPPLKYTELPAHPIPSYPSVACVWMHHNNKLHNLCSFRGVVTSEARSHQLASGCWWAASFSRLLLLLLPKASSWCMPAYEQLGGLSPAHHGGGSMFEARNSVVSIGYKIFCWSDICEIR